ncbi:MAG: anhydro-N-acetylmuramic acid kinase [Gammaproteobacteria bacterium]
MTDLYIGLMSGTSADGIDAVAVDFGHREPRLVASHYESYDPELRNEILALCQSGPDEINRLGELDVKLGKAFANVTRILLNDNGLKTNVIRAIGSHGQTIRHHPAKHFTLQIGDPNIIAAETGITTVADFRRRDMAYGGQGAPLVPAFHQKIFSAPKHDRVIVNIGGIANITVLPREGNILGFDTGPGNTLLDAWCEQHTNLSYDKRGAWAAEGKVQEKLLHTLLSDPFFKLAAPKSTGREYFNLAWLNNHLGNERPIDVQATLVELTVRSILDAIPFAQGEIFVCGGGAHNNYLMSRFAAQAEPFSVDSTLKLGINPDWVEAMAFAWLAKQTLEKKPGNIIAVTGAHHATILGGVYFA